MTKACDGPDLPGHGSEPCDFTENSPYFGRVAVAIQVLTDWFSVAGPPHDDEGTRTMIKMHMPGFTPVRLIGLLVSIGFFWSAMQVRVQAEERPAADAILVSLDQAKLVKLPSGAETIVIGNPAIADVAVQKNGVMVITGRAAGRTNFIALDHAGSIISESVVTVANPTQGRVVVLRGADQSTYDCAPSCLPTVSLGDVEKHFNGTVDQVSRRDGMTNHSASTGVAKK